MQQDYPAAHSMDSAWFAIDAAGQVGFFSTGEAGGLPSGCTLDQGEAYQLLEQLRAALPPSEPVFDPDGRLPGQERHWVYGPHALVFLDSLEPIRAELASGAAVEARATRGVAAIFTQLSDETKKRLHETGACRGCRGLYGDPGTEGGAARLGLFDYDHLTENWIAGPYGCSARPATPVKLSQLPPAIRAAAEGFQLPFRFDAAPMFQPSDHLPCTSWDAVYLSADGRTVRPQEEAHSSVEEALENMDLEDDGLVFDDGPWTPLDRPPAWLGRDTEAMKGDPSDEGGDDE